MKIPGSIWSPLLVGAMLGTTMVLFTKLPVAPRIEPTSVENTSFKSESLELTVVLESGEELRLKVTGATTMEVVQNLMKILKDMDGTLLLERSFPYTAHQAVSTMKKHVNSSSIMS
tara:strand:- start:5337 stop:5684 length:348 start_codon:yes stop_codon:yes gene_type:complete